MAWLNETAGTATFVLGHIYSNFLPSIPNIAEYQIERGNYYTWSVALSIRNKEGQFKYIYTYDSKGRQEVPSNKIVKIPNQCCDYDLTKVTHYSYSIRTYETENTEDWYGQGGTAYWIFNLDANKGFIPVNPNLNTSKKFSITQDTTSINIASMIGKMYGTSIRFNDQQFYHYILPIDTLQKNYKLEIDPNIGPTQTYEFTSSVYGFLDYNALISQGLSLPLKFNTKITNLKYNYIDSITPTLGSAFPFVRRNGAQSYRTFTIESMIAFEADEMKEFIKLPSIDDVQDNYDKNLLKQRIYRDAVLEFIHDGKVKLFRSAQEGDMIVRLSNISLTPNAQLDRNIWTFSAQATEVAAPTMENLEKYGLAIVGPLELAEG